MFMQMIPAISISGGKPAQGMPLTFVVILSMIKDAYEDYKKGVNDKTENEENKVDCKPFNAQQFKNVEWQNV